MDTVGKNKRVYWYVGLTALMLAAVACTCGPLSNLPGVGSASGEPTPTLISLDGGSSSGGDGSGDNGSGDNASLNFDASGLKTYRSKFTMNYTGTKEDGTPIDGTFTMEQSHTSDPDATAIHWIGDGEAVSAENKNDMNMVLVDGITYVITPVDGVSKCISMAGNTGATGMNSPAYSPDSFLTGSDMSGAKRVLPDEIVNGVLSQHWKFTKDDVSLLAPGWTSYTVDAWTAVDGGYGVKSVFVGDGDNISGAGGKGHVEWEYNLLEANTDVTIEIPEGCSAPVGSDLPKMPDASDEIAMEGFSSYSSASALADVVAFYQAQMPAAGWTAGETTNAGPTTILKFTKDGKTANITIAESDGKTTVLVQIQ